MTIINIFKKSYQSCFTWAFLIIVPAYWVVMDEVLGSSAVEMKDA